MVLTLSGHLRWWLTVPVAEDGEVRIARIGLASVKGTRHQSLPQVDLTWPGPAGDRICCLIDPVRRQVLRTVANPSLLAVSARWEGKTLTVELGNQRVTGRPEVSGTTLDVDYWGRSVQTEVLEGPWSAAFSDYLDRQVVLAAAPPRAVVYGGSVSLVTTASLKDLRPPSRDFSGQDLDAGQPEVDSARFRATFLIDTSGAQYDSAGVEFSWLGRQLQLGAATVRVTGAIVRCAVVDLNPLSGHADLRLLTALPRSRGGEPVFGVEGEVVQPGVVGEGAEVFVAG